MAQKKILFVSNIAGKKIGSFSATSIYAAHVNGLEFHIASNFSQSPKEQQKRDERDYDIVIHHIDFVRNPLHPGNLKAYRQLVQLMQKENFDAVHCNTPVGGVYGRFAANRCGIKTIIYQAHGFHFYKGAPLMNQIIFKGVEKVLAHWTDAIITINQEDFEAARKFKLRNKGAVYYVPGVGIDVTAYEPQFIKRDEVRHTLNLNENDIVCISMGDLIPRKNYCVAIEAIAKCKNDKLHYLICGKGPELESLQKLTKDLGVEKQIHFLGFRSDIKELLQAADIFLFTTLQEGMPRSMMEAMASGLPCIASKIRGNVDLLEDGKGGYLIPVDSVDEAAERLNDLAGDSEKREEMARNNLLRILDFDTGKVKHEIERIYEEELQSTGGGVKLSEFIPLRVRKRIELSVPLDSLIILSVGELNKNKNNKLIIKAIAKLENSNIHYVLCGIGDEEEELRRLSAKLGIKNKVHFLGYRKDVREIYGATDIFALPSYREGLSRSLMEAMASGLPCIVSDIRGNRDLIDDEGGGFLIPKNDIKNASEKIRELAENAELREQMASTNREKSCCFDINRVEGIITEIYEKELRNS